MESCSRNSFKRHQFWPAEVCYLDYARGQPPTMDDLGMIALHSSAMQHDSQTGMEAYDDMLLCGNAPPLRLCSSPLRSKLLKHRGNPVY
jgi:hypothetical protein